MAKSNVYRGLGLAPNPQLNDQSKPGLKHEAIALSYVSGDFAPKVVAKGRGVIAEQIIERAKQHNIFVHESKDLVALLMQVDLDSHIPPELYKAIAEILAWLYRLEEESGDAHDGHHPF